MNVRRLVGDNLALTVQIIGTLITGFVIAMIADWKLSLVILCVIPLVGIQGYAQVKFLKGFSQDAKVIHETKPLGCSSSNMIFCKQLVKLNILKKAQQKSASVQNKTL